MRTLYVLIKNNLRILVLKKTSYTIMLVVCPVIISVFLSTFIGNHSSSSIKIGVMDKSKSISSEEIINSLITKDIIDVINIKNEEEVEKNFVSKDIDVAIIIDEDFEGKLLRGDTSGILIKGLENENIHEMISGVIGYDIANFKKIAAINNGEYIGYKDSLKKYDSNNIEISKESLNDLYGDYSNSQTLIGFLVMFAFFRAMSGSMLIGEDKEQHIYTRVLVAQVSLWQYYLSNILSTLLLLMIQIIITIVGINILSDINIGMSSLELFVVLLTVSIVAVSIGCFCVTVTNSRELSSIISNFILMTFLFLGGCFVPVRAFTDFLNKISYFTPTRWVMEAIINLQQGREMAIVLSDLGIVILFALAFFTTSIYSISKRDKVDSLI